jgi:hypothetical protein
MFFGTTQGIVGNFGFNNDYAGWSITETGSRTYYNNGEA